MMVIMVVVMVVVVVTTTDTGSMMVVLVLLRVRMIVTTAATFIAHPTDSRRGRVLRPVMFAIRKRTIAPVAPVGLRWDISPSDALVVAAGLDHHILRSQHRRTGR